MKETHRLLAACAHLDRGLGLNLQPRSVPLTGNRTLKPSEHRLMLQPLRTAARAHLISNCRRHRRESSKLSGNMYLWLQPSVCRALGGNL